MIRLGHIRTVIRRKPKEREKGKRLVKSVRRISRHISTYIGGLRKVARRIFWKRVISGKQLMEGYRVPRGWGVSYIVWDADFTIIHPLPLNYIVAGVRWLLHKIKLPWFMNQEKQRMQKEYFRGWTEGWKDCAEINLKNRAREMEDKDVLCRSTYTQSILRWGVTKDEAC